MILLSDPRHEAIAGKPVKPHVPLLFFREPPAIEVPCLEARGSLAFRLNGARLRITNGVHAFARHESFDHSIPHITPPHVQLEPREDVILDGAAPAAAYFDIEHGILSACRSTARGAVGTTLTIDTGDAAPILEIACFGTQHITLAHDAVLEIVNVAEHGQDDDNDYLLNYGVVKALPPDPRPPDPPSAHLPFCTILAAIELDFGPPCSNSGYP